MTATSFLLANNDALFLNGTHLQPLNLYTMSVGHPGTGKSPAIETVLVALRDVDTITKETLVSATTTSGLVKTISKQGKAFAASPELFDILNKLLKNDEDNATGDVQFLRKLWSGESASYHFATGATREIELNTAFSLLGSTQIQNAALLIFRMDNGHGLLDRFLISDPDTRKPTPEQGEEATEYLEGLQLKDFQTVFASVHAAHRDIARSCRLNAPAAVNAAIQNGEVPLKSKGTDKKAVQYVEYLHAQKVMFADFIKETVETSKDKPRPQPTELDIIAAILRFQGDWSLTKLSKNSPEMS